MAETTDIEKKSLEAHVELCAERYKFLENKLDTVDSKITALESMIRELHDMLHGMGRERNDQIINWGLGIIGTMVAVIGYLLAVYVVK